MSMVSTYFLGKNVYKIYSETNIILSMEGSPTKVENVSRKKNIFYLHLVNLSEEFS